MGLAAGIGAIAATTMGLMAIYSGKDRISRSRADGGFALAGACIGFSAP